MKCTKNYKEKYIIQLTADNPLIDYRIIDYMVSFFKKNHQKYDFVTNNNLFNKRRLFIPDGMIVSIFKKEAYGQGFEIEAVVFCRAIRRNLKIIEFPSYEQSRWNGTSNLKAIKDGARVLIAIFIERLRSQRKY